MDEIKAIIGKADSMSKEELIKAIPDLLEKAKAVGFVKVAEEVPEISDLIRNKMAEFEVDEAIDMMKQFMPVMFDAMKELAETDEDIQDEIEDIEDTAVTMMIEEADFAMTLIVKDGKFDFKLEAVEDADLVLKMTKESMKGMLSGESDPVQAYKAGEVKAEGNLTKAMAMRSIFEVLGEKFGFEMM